MKLVHRFLKPKVEVPKRLLETYKDRPNHYVENRIFMQPADAQRPSPTLIYWRYTRIVGDIRCTDAIPVLDAKFYREHASGLTAHSVVISEELHSYLSIVLELFWRPWLHWPTQNPHYPALYKARSELLEGLGPSELSFVGGKLDQEQLLRKREEVEALESLESMRKGLVSLLYAKNSTIWLRLLLNVSADGVSSFV